MGIDIVPFGVYNVPIDNKRKEMVKMARRQIDRLRVPTRLSKERTEDIKEVVENLRHMSEKSVLLMKNAAEVLRVRDEMDGKEKNPA